jgi:hypothetical protein
MTGQEILTKFTEMVDDVVDEDFALQLLNDAKDEIEAMQIWEMLKKEQAYSVAQGYSFTSALGALPTRFSNDIRFVEGDSNTDYDKVSFEDRVQKENNPTGYFLDLSNNNIHLSGQNHTAKTMYLYFTQYSADITAGTSWVFPSRFHSILPLKMAELYYFSDAGDRGRSWDEKWAIQYERGLARMTIWNDSLKLRNRSAYSRNPSFTPKSIR